MNEEWKVYKRTKRTVYEVSNKGACKQNGVLFVPKITKMKYLKCGQFPIHRMVAEMFVDNDDVTKTHVDHIDGNKLNNRADNLRWVSQTENNRNPITLKRFSDSHKGKRWTEKQKLAQQGHVWITNNINNTRVRLNDIDLYLDKGYHRGRTLKKEFC